MTNIDVERSTAKAYAAVFRRRWGSKRHIDRSATSSENVVANGLGAVVLLFVRGVAVQLVGISERVSLN